MREKVLLILSTVLNETLDINKDITKNNCSNWDSLKHIEIIMTIEEEFGVSIDINDIPKLDSLEKIVAKLEELL